MTSGASSEIEVPSGRRERGGEREREDEGERGRERQRDRERLRERFRARGLEIVRDGGRWKERRETVTGGASSGMEVPKGCVWSTESASPPPVQS